MKFFGRRADLCQAALVAAGDATYPFCAVNEEKRAEVLHNFINITTFAARNEPRLLKALKMNHLFFHIFN